MYVTRPVCCSCNAKISMYSSVSELGSCAESATKQFSIEKYKFQMC
jgi:hypothetical protein